MIIILSPAKKMRTDCMSFSNEKANRGRKHGERAAEKSQRGRGEGAMSGILETKRLMLRPWEEADAEECFRYAKDPRVGPIAGWPVHTDVENSRQIIRDVLAVPETYAIILRETGLPIGSIGLHHNDLARGEDEAELGYWLGVPYWGHGLVPEAAREVLRHAFEDLGLARVWCAYYEGNEKSRRVQEKLGFRFQWVTENAPVPLLKEARNDYVNLMIREDWLNLTHIRQADADGIR